MAPDVARARADGLGVSGVTELIRGPTMLAIHTAYRKSPSQIIPLCKIMGITVEAEMTEERARLFQGVYVLKPQHTRS